MLKQFFSLGNNVQSQKIGANAHIINQINSLQIEKDILTKTISRLYDTDSEFTKVQRDRLLLRYQHQLGVVIARIEKLELISKHPDLGPLGEGLITLMDQKLSNLDQRLYELTSKIKVTEEKRQIPVKKMSKIIQKTQEPAQTQLEKTKPVFEKPISNFVEKSDEIITNKFEITTLTPRVKLDSFKQTKYDQMLSQLESDVIAPPRKPSQISINPKQEIIPAETKSNIPKPLITEQPKQPIQLPEEPIIDDDDDDLEQIKSKIMKTLSKIEQAEVD
tara:strand:- start:61 stop:888 length:828 start_codon:yes stop_codon:yes gene_type:complete